MDGVEAEQEEIVVVRNNKPIARLIPEPPAQTALQVLGDLYRTLDDETADALVAAINRGKKPKRGTLRELRNPWAAHPIVDHDLEKAFILKHDFSKAIKTRKRIVRIASLLFTSYCGSAKT